MTHTTETMSNDVKLSELADELERLVSARNEPARLMRADHPQALQVAVATSNRIDRSLAEFVESNLSTILTALRDSTDRDAVGRYRHKARGTEIAAWNTRHQPQREAVLEDCDIAWLWKVHADAQSKGLHADQRKIERILAALTTPAPAAAQPEREAVLEEGNKRGLYDTTKIGPELVAFLDDRSGMLTALRDEMSEGYRGWLDDAVEALRIARDHLAALTAPVSEGSATEIAEKARSFAKSKTKLLREVVESRRTTPAPAQKPHCSTCGKDVAEVLCETCGKWWADNPPPAPAVSTDEIVAVLEGIKARGLPDRYKSDVELNDRLAAILSRLRGEG